MQGIISAGIIYFLQLSWAQIFLLKPFKTLINSLNFKTFSFSTKQVFVKFEIYENFIQSYKVYSCENCFKSNVVTSFTCVSEMHFDIPCVKEIVM